MKQQLPGHSAWLHALRQSKAVRQTTALFVKNVLVAWRNRWSTGIRLLAPLLFLALALVVQEALGANARRTGRIRDTPVSLPVQTSSIPNCHSELFIHDKPCLDFIYTPNNDTTVKAIVEAIQQHNDPPIPDARVLGFSSRADADRFIQQRKAFVLGGVHFSYGVSDRLQYIVQSNTTVPTFKGYVQSPNNFFQMPFISAIAREVSRYYLQQAGRHSEAVNLQWQPSMVPFPHPKLSAGTAGYILPPFIFVACMFATISTLGMLVSEKESGLRQALQTMGLLQGSYWLSWWLFEAVMAAIVAWCIIGFGAALQLRMFTTNSVWLMFLLFWLFGMAMSSFACCVSVFLSSSQSASNAGLAIVLAGWVCQALAALGVPYAPNILYTPNGMGKVFLWIFMLFPWNPLTKGVLDMSAAANSSLHPGLKFAQRSSYCRYVPHPSKAAAGSMSWLYLEDNCIFSIQQCFITLLIQAIAWMVAAVYLDNVQPNKHGVRLPLWYPLLPGYWGNLFKAATSYWNQQGSFRGPSAAAASAKFRTKSPFAATEVNRKVARSITDAKEGELVIRCSSSPGIPAEQHKGFMASVGQNSTIHRHSVSSGLRRRETRQSSAAGDPMPSVDLGNRAVVQSTMGKLPNFPQHSTQLLVQNSVTVLRLSDGSSEAASTAGVAQTIGPGQTMTLQQYQQMQQQPKPSSMSDKKWWEFWRVPESSMALAAKKHGSLVAAAAVTAPGSVSDKDVGAVTYGMVPVVLDPGVLQEEQRMKAAWYTDSDGPWTSRHDMVQVFGLRKVYKMPASTKKRRWWPPCGSSRKQQQLQAVCQQQQRLQHFVAVADSWFGVPKGQLLCLLGPNGAGKTTSINCLIGALPPTGGDIRVMGQSLLAPGGLEVAQSVMGVCPQFDVLWDELSGSEHMYIYGCIKGLQSAEVKEEGARLLEQVQLTFAAKKRSSSYSGGMKRRLSVALALLGRPSLVYLDEPSTGMDPISRRAVWDAINAAKQHAAVVLTTHSMEEADALGDRIGIMVRGRMRVLGGSLTLKQKYGNGYQLKLRLKDSHVVEQLLPHTCQHLTIQAASTADVSCGPSSTPMDGIQPAVPQPGHSSAARIIGSPASARSAASGHAPVNQGSSVLQELVAEHLGLAPTEEGRQMLHYVIPQALAPQLQVLLEMLDDPEQQQQLGLAEVHVSLATLEEVFLTVVKQAEQDHAALHGHTVMVELPETGQQLEVPVGQEAAVEPATGDVYAVEWVQDEWGKLAVLGVRLMEQAEQQRYWQNRHVQQ